MPPDEIEAAHSQIHIFRDAAEKKLAEFTDPYRTKDKIKILRELTLLLGDAEAHQMAIEDAKPALAIKDCFESYSRSMHRTDCCDATLRIYERHCNKLIKWMKEHHPDMIELRDITPAGLLPALAQVNAPISTTKIFAAINVLSENDLRTIRDAIDKRLAIAV